MDVLTADLWRRYFDKLTTSQGTADAKRKRFERGTERLVSCAFGEMGRRLVADRSRESRVMTPDTGQKPDKNRTFLSYDNLPGTLYGRRTDTDTPL